MKHAYSNTLKSDCDCQLMIDWSSSYVMLVLSTSWMSASDASRIIIDNSRVILQIVASLTNVGESAVNRAIDGRTYSN